jgi:WXG100 family type VII secretion target
MANQMTSVDIAGMQAAQTSFQNALDQVNTAYNNMSEQQGALAANWSGETSSKFGMALEKWLEDFQIVQKELASIIDTLGTNTGVYANTEDESTQMANAFANGMSTQAGLGI